MFENHVTAHLCADIVVLGYHNGKHSVLLIERAKAPYQNRWAFPGGHVDEGETFLETAQRELREETGLTVAIDQFYQVGIYDEPYRDPRGRYISVAYCTVIDEPFESVAGDDARTAQWVALADVKASPRERFAFDHYQIFNDVMNII